MINQSASRWVTFCGKSMENHKDAIRVTMGIITIATMLWATDHLFGLYLKTYDQLQRREFPLKIKDQDRTNQIDWLLDVETCVQYFRSREQGLVMRKDADGYPLYDPNCQKSRVL